jgi:catechol 2,3-dioxygenase-like lactoylglutathione lyase family enzyme
MQLRFVRVLVKNQDQALAFYTEKLGFSKKADMMMGSHRFLTVAAPKGIEGVQLILEATDFPPSKVYQRECYKAGTPALSINTDDIAGDHDSLRNHGVHFVAAPEDLGPIICATFDDGCGNWVYLVQTKPR